MGFLRCMGFLRLRSKFHRGGIRWVKSLGVSGSKSCSRRRNSGSLILGVLQSGCRAEQRQYGSCSSAGWQPKDLRKSRTVRVLGTSRFCRTNQPNSYPSRNEAGGIRKSRLRQILGWASQRRRQAAATGPPFPGTNAWADGHARLQARSRRKGPGESAVVRQPLGNRGRRHLTASPTRYARCRAASLACAYAWG